VSESNSDENVKSDAEEVDPRMLKYLNFLMDMEVLEAEKDWEYLEKDLEEYGDE
jgi:hypothetical protein